MKKAENDMSIDLSYKRVFHAAKDGKVDLYIANKDFTKFKSLEQFIANNGETEIKTIDVKGIIAKLKKLNKKYCNIYAKLKIYNKITHTFEKMKNLKPEKIELFNKMEAAREKEANAILGDTNKYLEKIDCHLSSDGSYRYHDRICLFPHNDTEYFLPTGEKLTQSSGSVLFGGVFDHGYNFNFLSIHDLECYRAKEQKEYDKEANKQKCGEDKEQNNETF